MRVLVLCDDRWHPAEIVRKGLEPLARSGFSFDYMEDPADWASLRIVDYPVVVLSKANNVSEQDESTWMTPEIENELVDYVRGGNGLLVVHSGSVGYSDCPDLRRLVGGTFVSHPPECEVTVTPRPGHPLTSGAEPFSVLDEHYMMELDDSDADVFMTSSSEHGEQPAGWTRADGEGRVCMLTPGNCTEVWLHQSFQILLENALRWCASSRRIALVTGADRGLGIGLASQLLGDGWKVFAGQYLADWPELDSLAEQHPTALRIVPLDVGSSDSVRAATQFVAEQAPHLDMLVNNAGVSTRTNPLTIRESLDYDEMRRLYEINSLGPLRVVEAFLPLLDASEFRRLCFVSSEAGSVTASKRDSWFAYCMSKAALNMGVRNMFNGLRPSGYTFRVYHPGWVQSYIGGERNDSADLKPEEAAAYAIPIFVDSREDEDRLVLIDYLGNEWPW